MKKVVYFAFAAALALVSCAKEEAPVEKNAKVTTIYANMAGTKSTVAIDGEKALFSWTANETISVATEEEENFVDFTCTDPDKGEFTYNGEVTPLVAVSPAQNNDAEFTDEANCSVVLPETYTYEEGKTNAIMIGTKGDGNTFIFGHAATLLAITYENLPDGTKGITVTADENIAGKVVLSGTDASDIEIKNDNDDLNSKTVTITHDATVGNTASRTYYLPLPTGSYGEISFQIIHDDDAIAASTVKTVKNVNLTRGQFAQLPAATLAEGFVPYTVGNENNTDGFNSNRSESYAIQAGKVLHLEFTNYSSQQDVWNNWNIAIANKAFGADGYAEYFLLRSDAYGWTPATNFNDTPTLRNDLTHTSSTGNFDSYKEDMDEASVNMTVENTFAGSVLFKAVATAKNGHVYTTTYKYPVAPEEDIYALLMVDHSHFVINKAWYSDSKKVLKHYASAYDYYLHNESLDLDVVGTPKKIKAVYTDDSDSPVDFSLLTDIATGVKLTAEAGEQKVPAKFNGNDIDLVIPVKIGTSAFGSATLTTAGWAWGPYADTALTAPISWTMFVYSSAVKTGNGGDNYKSPCIRVTGKDFVNYGHFRMDNWGWWDAIGGATSDTWAAGNFVNNNRNIERNSDWDWDIYEASLNHSIVTITLSYETTATVTFQVKYWDGSTHTQTFSNIPIQDGETILAGGLFTEQSYAVVF